MKKFLIQLSENKESGIYVSLIWNNPHIYTSLDIGKLLCKIRVIITEAQNSNSTTDTHENMYYCSNAMPLVHPIEPPILTPQHFS